MASNINPNSIDRTFPIPGQSNPSQGFRDNFTNISNNFTTAATEITDLQSKAILKTALIGGTLDNNMGGSTMSAVQLAGAGYIMYSLGSVTGAQVLNFSNGNVQQISTAGPVNISFSNWPTSGVYANMILWITINSLSHTVQFSTTNPGVTYGLSQVPGIVVDPIFNTGTITFDEPGTYLLSFSTVDNGNNILVTDLTRNFASLRGNNLYFNPDVINTLLVNYGNSLGVALQLEQGQDSVSALGSYNSVSIGSLAAANIGSPGAIAGYSVTGARGNSQTVTLSPVTSNDFLGYVNSISLTGNGTPTIGNVFQQASSIGFYATGANVVYGLGGNIAFFTKQDGVSGTVGNYPVFQAMGIENDQSVRLQANLVLSATSSGGSGTSSYVPLHNTSIGTTGQVAWDQTYFYTCTATNTWKRTAWGSTSW